MIQDKTARELADCMERLRWIFGGYKAGGVQGWTYTPPKSREEVHPAAACQTEEKLSRISIELTGCTRCKLHSGRTNLVFGEGSAKSGLVFVGEGPGFDEDRQGRPFVGRAGKLLDKMIFADRFREAGSLYLQCRKVPPAGEPGPSSGRSSRMFSLPVQSDRGT